MTTTDNELAETMQGAWLLHFCALYMAHNPQANPTLAIEAARATFDAVKVHQEKTRTAAPPPAPAPVSPAMAAQTTPAPPTAADEFSPAERAEMRKKKTQRAAATLLRTALASNLVSYGAAGDPSQAVVDFQSVIEGLATDGVLGPLTRAAGLALGVEFPTPPEPAL
jgi:hypothetical protein